VHPERPTTQPQSMNYPFSAIIAQERLKLALILAAIDPGIGGVLIEGPRGTAKSTCARALADLLLNGQMVTLPLGSSEERLLGSLNLEKVLADGSVEFLPGLLHRAHNGMLYVDEVNLLADHLVDLLLDVAASGINRVERDGLSHEHAAHFVLIGTMNPDEGELRPQLLDRFGLCVRLDEEIPTEQRTEIVRHRLAFDENPKAFCDRWLAHQKNLKENCRNAQNLMENIEYDQQSREKVAELCFSARVDGVRADLTFLKAARAHAALHGRCTIQEQDIESVAEFALLHRRKSRPDSNSSNQAFQPPSADQQDKHSADSDWGEVPPQPASIGDRRSLDSIIKKKV